MRAVGFCEIEPYCRKVLARHWPGIPILMKTSERSPARAWQQMELFPDVICGRIPSARTLVSPAKAQGIIGRNEERSLGFLNTPRNHWRSADPISSSWKIRRKHPTSECSSTRCSGTWRALGYDAEWHCIRPAKLAPHARDRVWIVAHPSGSRLEGSQPICGRLERSIATLALDGNSFADAWKALESGLGDIRVGDGVSARMDKRSLVRWETLSSRKSPNSSAAQYWRTMPPSTIEEACHAPAR